MTGPSHSWALVMSWSQVINCVIVPWGTEAHYVLVLYVRAEYFDVVVHNLCFCPASSTGGDELCFRVVRPSVRLSRCRVAQKHLEEFLQICHKHKVVLKLDELIRFWCSWVKETHTRITCDHTCVEANNHNAVILIKAAFLIAIFSSDRRIT